MRNIPPSVGRDRVVHLYLKSAKSSRTSHADPHTNIQIIKLQEISFLVQLVRMAVEKRKDGQQLRQRLFCNVHQRGLVSEGHRRAARARPFRIHDKRLSDGLRGGRLFDLWLGRRAERRSLRFLRRLAMIAGGDPEGRDEGAHCCARRKGFRSAIRGPRQYSPACQSTCCTYHASGP